MVVDNFTVDIRFIWSIFSVIVYGHTTLKTPEPSSEMLTNK